MSCFMGTFPSLPGISCDRFDTELNLTSDQFFLTHCHSDHMQGLEQLCRQLNPRNAVRINHRIYCSMISKAFIVRKYPFLDERFVCDTVDNVPIVLNVFDKAQSVLYKLRVTSIPANHCPGSVMFLFEKLDDNQVSRRILYTGDFRLEDANLCGLRTLHRSGDGDNLLPLPIDEMYLDTTFCTPRYSTFPTRKESMSRIWQIVDPWIKKNGMYRNHKAKHVVLLHLPAEYGSEALLNFIYEKSGLKWRIHVSDRKYQDYLCSDDLSDCTDCDARHAQWIHACSWQGKHQAKKNSVGKRLPCQQGPFEVCSIRPSAMYFTQDRIRNLEDKIVDRVRDGYYRVCYSSHSSFSELIEFVRHFQPRKLVPCVIPKDMTMEEVLAQFSSVLKPESINVEDTEELLGHLSPFSSSSEEFHCTSPRMEFLRTLSSPPDTKSQSSSRKRKMGVSVEGNEHAKKSLIFQDAEDDQLAALSKRSSFQRSKSSKANYSMPSMPKRSVPSQQNRRASLPHNIKIPEIKITPSSPSPDPNHPDYPEFYEDPMYIVSKNKSSSSTESSKEMEVDHDFVLKLTPDDENEQESNETSEKTSHLSSSGGACSPDAEAELAKNIEHGRLALDDLDSTPEFDDVFAQAETEQEIQNCLGWKRRQMAKDPKQHISST